MYVHLQAALNARVLLKKFGQLGVTLHLQCIISPSLIQSTGLNISAAALQVGGTSQPQHWVLCQPSAAQLQEFNTFFAAYIPSFLSGFGRVRMYDA